MMVVPESKNSMHASTSDICSTTKANASPDLLYRDKSRGQNRQGRSMQTSKQQVRYDAVLITTSSSQATVPCYGSATLPVSAAVNKLSSSGMQQAPAHTSSSHNVSCMPTTLTDRQTDRQTQADRQMQADRPAANRHRQADRQHRLVDSLDKPKGRQAHKLTDKQPDRGKVEQVGESAS